MKPKKTYLISDYQIECFPSYWGPAWQIKLQDEYVARAAWGGSVEYWAEDLPEGHKKVLKEKIKQQLICHLTSSVARDREDAKIILSQLK